MVGGGDSGASAPRFWAEAAQISASNSGSGTSSCRASLSRVALARRSTAALAAGVEVRCTVQPIRVRGVPAQLAEVFSNLIANAIRYNNSGGHVDVTLSQMNGSAVLTVANDGAGIPQEALPFVFDRFFQVDPARSRKSGGAGLGLALAQRIVRAHGGELAVASRFGIGSTFTVTLPAQAAGDGKSGS